MTGPHNAGRGIRLPWRLLLAAVAVAPFAIPFVWLVGSALKPLEEFYAAPPTLLPVAPSLDLLAGVVRLVDLPRLVANSMVIALASVVATVVSSSLAGFAFATIPARGRGPLFALLVATILIPPSAVIVPQFILFGRLGWVGTWLPLIVPHLFGSAFYIFLFRQWFRNLPANVFESAELDGANPFQQYRHIALPLARPAIAAVAAFAFVGSWNDFLGPLVYLRSADSFTVSLGLASFQGVYTNQVHHAVAFALIALVPPMLVFVAAQRVLVPGSGATWQRPA